MAAECLFKSRTFFVASFIFEVEKKQLCSANERVEAAVMLHQLCFHKLKIVYIILMLV